MKSLSRAVFTLLSALFLLLLSPSFSQAQQMSFGTEAAAPASVSAELNLTALQPGGQAVVAVVLDVSPNFHAQSNTPYDENLIKTTITLPDTGDVSAFAPIYPPGHDETFPALGKINVYTGRTIFFVPIQIAANAKAADVTISGSIEYQICDDKSCLAPETVPFTISTRVVASGQPIAPNKAELFATFDPSVFSHLVKPAASTKKIELFGFDLDQSPRILVFVAAFLIGIIFNVVPCVLPVLPLKAIGFYEVSQHNRAKCMIFGAVFSLGLIATFAVLGLLVVVLKRFAWGELFSNIYFLAAIVLVLLVMALNMFGTFDVGLPTWIYRITPRHDTYSGNFLFGILTAVLSTPCTIGLFVALLAWAVQQPPALGLSLVTMVGVGMAFPYFALSAFPELARRFPRTGPWSELVKQMMGFLLLASAVYFARRFIAGISGDKFFWYALFGLVLFAAIFLIYKTSRITVSKGLGIAVAISLAFAVPAGVIIWRITHPPIDWQEYSENALAAARQSGRPVMLEFTADWCGNCLYLESSVFQDAAVVKTIKSKDVITLRADLSSADAAGWKLLREINPVGAIPLTAIYVGNAPPERLAGIYSSGELIEQLNRS